jgi:uncharacterized membrane protein
MSASILVLVALTVITAVVAVYRKFVSTEDDSFVHVNDPTGELNLNHRVTDQTVSRVDRIGITLTVVTALYGVSLVVIFLYNGLTQYRG